MAKNKKNNNSNQPISPAKYIKEAARKLPVFECVINEGWAEGGIAQIMVTRQKQHGNFLVGVYIVDTFCLGLKNTLFYENLTPYEYEFQKNRVAKSSGQNWEEISPNTCFNIIYGAIEYAEDLGFQPNKDFDVTEYILDDVESIDFEDIEFGQNGKPYYFAGPYDDVKKVISTLKRSVGDGNFDFTMPMGGSSYDGTVSNDFGDDDEDEGEDMPHVPMLGLEIEFLDENFKIEDVLNKDAAFQKIIDDTDSIIDVTFPENEIVIFKEGDKYDENYSKSVIHIFEKYFDELCFVNLYFTISGEGKLEAHKAKLQKEFFTLDNNTSRETQMKSAVFMEHFPDIAKQDFLKKMLNNSPITQYMNEIMEYIKSKGWEKQYIVLPFINYGDKVHWDDTEDHISIGITFDKEG